MRLFVSILLICTALLKAFQVVFDPSALAVLSHWRHVKPLLIGSELGLGLIALIGFRWQQVRWFLLVLFAGFACYTLTLAIWGINSCGCLGPVEINPWWIFLLDMVVLGGLVTEALLERDRQYEQYQVTRGLTISLLFSVAFISAATAVGLAWQSDRHQNNSLPGVHTAGEFVVLEPEFWVGKPFPLSAHVGIDVSQGSWIVLFHRSNCSQCQTLIPRYEQLASLDSRYQVALIEVSPSLERQELEMSACHLSQLDDNLEWFVETPLEIQLEHGVVVSASTDCPMLNSLTSRIDSTH